MFDINHLIQTGGLLLIALIIFSESGMMVGFFLPGDTLLLSAGIFAAQGKLSIAVTILVIAVAAIIGDNVGYLIGKHLGPRLFRKKDSLVFRQEYLSKAEAFYEKYGNKTMLIAHFVPVIRAFVPVTAGAARMDHRKFILYDAIGDIAWTFVLVLLGYFVASRIPGVEKYVEPALILVILATVLPSLYHLLKDPKIRAAISRKFKKS
jgi:membrane-associated protein